MKQEKNMAEQLIVCGKPYRILRLLGHGKGGYSYLAEDDGQQVVVKQIHHEPCERSMRKKASNYHCYRLRNSRRGRVSFLLFRGNIRNKSPAFSDVVTVRSVEHQSIA